MTATDVQSEIIEPMQRLYLPPRNYDEGQQGHALREYVSALEDINREDLRQAWRIVRDAHTTRSWPLPAAFILAARKAKSDRAPASLAAQRGNDSGERWERWKTIRRSELAREAVRRQVAWSLKCAVLHDGKRAEEIDLRAFVIARASAERTADAIRSGNPIAWHGRSLSVGGNAAEAALSLWDGILRAEAETEAEINYGREAA